MLAGKMLMASGGGSLFDILTSLGLTTNLEVVLDAGDALSYSSGQPWLDRTANGFDFNRGATSGSEASDPTFNGGVGNLSANEYWSFDGGDFFRYDSANETWMNNLHKNNAIFTFMSLIFKNATGTLRAMAGTSAAQGGNVGTDWEIDATEHQRIVASRSTAGNALVFAADNVVPNAAWHMLAVSIDEPTGAGAGFLYRDGAYDQVSSSDTFDATYSSPNTGDATYTMEIGAAGNAVNPLLNTERMACFAAWEGTALTKTQLDTIWARIRGRFGI